MEEQIVNRVANSALMTIDLEEHFPAGERLQLDLSQWLDGGFVLREKEFRQALKEFDWSAYTAKHVALHCSTDAILPGWAYMLVTTYLAPVAGTVVLGDMDDLELELFRNTIDDIDLSIYIDRPVIVKGCANKPIPEQAYIYLLQKLQPIAKSLMYGEACSSVPLFKPKK